MFIKISEFIILITLSLVILQILSSIKDPYDWAANPSRIRLSIFFELVQRYANAQGYGIEQLYPYQRKGIKKIFRKKNVFIVVPTAGGKTLIAFACLWKALNKQRIGVYLVPQNQLLAQKVKEITRFFGNLAHVVTLSGEFKPPVYELRKNWKNLILVGTYEAFRAFLFSIQLREYFPTQKCIGGVVIDEVHMISDKERGPKLETMIYKLQQEYKCQICCLSATVNTQSAQEWSHKFKCDLIYLNSTRMFHYEERLIVLDEEEKQERSKRKFRTLLFEKEKEEVIQVIEAFIEEHEDQSYLPYKLFPAKMLIFCYSRDYAEQLAFAINERWGMTTDVHCDYLHAGIDRDDQRDIFTNFNVPEGIRILCCSPLLETGVDISNVETIVILNPERYDGIRLAQMCGRTREEVGKVIFIFLEENRNLINRNVEFDGESSNLKLKGFILEPIRSRITTNDIESWLALEALCGHELSRAELKHQLQKFKVGFDIDEILSPKEKLVKNAFIRQSGGRYGLTFIGIATVETGLEPDDVIACQDFFQKMGKSEEKAGEKFFSVTVRKLLGTLVANIAYSDPAHYLDVRSSIWVLLKRFQAKSYIYSYNSENWDQNENHRNLYEIKEGDAEIFRRTAVWIASSLYTLYQGFKLHSGTLTTEQQYYQLQTELPYMDDQVMFRRLLRLIHRYQKYDETRTRKPRVRQHPIHISDSQYKEPILKILEDCKTKGTIKQEIRQQLMEKLKFAVPDSSIHSTLMHTLRDKVVRQLEPTGKGNRLRHRYRLIKYQPQKPKEIAPTTQHLRKKPHLFHDFEIIDEQVKCPACYRLGSVQIPTEEKLTQCKGCKAVFRRTRWGHYKWKTDCVFEDDRIFNDSGFPYIKITPEKRCLFLKEKEKLQLRQKKSGMPYFSIMGRGGAFFYPEEIYEIVLAGGEIGSGVDLLKKHQIRLKPLSVTEIQGVKEEEEKAQKLRAAIRVLEGTARLKKARDLTISKLLSNLYYTFKFIETLTDEIIPYKKAQDLILRQYDHLTQVLLTLEEKLEIERDIAVSTMLVQLFIPILKIKTLNLNALDIYYSARLIDRLRSQEGNAEIAAWEVVKIALPIQFQFDSRQIQRAVRSDLYWGPKGRDPFNCGLNYLYYLLGDKVAIALHKAGFSRYWPGPGIIHKRRQTGTKRTWVETRENREFLYDFIDLFRAPFRYHLAISFRRDYILKTETSNVSPLERWHRENIITPTDFYYELDEWHERVYFPTEEGEVKLKELFNLICAHKFLDGTEEKPFDLLMHEKAQDFADSLVGKKTDPVIFLAFEEQQGGTRVLSYFDLIHHFMEYDRIQALQEALSEIPPLEPVPEPVTEGRLENIIIITHNDFDGFASALLLLIQHFQARNLNIIVAENYPTHTFHVTKVLENVVPSLLWKRGHNTVIVADFPISLSENSYRALREKYVGKLKGHDDRLRWLWYDHHSNPAFEPMRSSEELGIEFTHVSDERRHAYLMIWADLIRKAAAEPEQGKRPWDFFKDLTLSANGWLAKIDDYHYLNKWYAAFRTFYAKPAKRPKNWVKFFMNVCMQKSAPKLDETISKAILFHGSIRKTKDGKTFALLIFRDYFDVRNVKALLQIYTQQQFPDFILCYWVNHSISLRVFNKESVNLLGLLTDQGLGGHRGAGAIYAPRQKRYQAGSVSLFTLQLIDEFVAKLTKSRLTLDPRDIFEEDVINIPAHKEEEIKTWNAEEIMHEDNEESYSYKDTIFYMPEYRDVIAEALSQKTSPFISTAKNSKLFEEGIKPLTLQFSADETLDIPSNDIIIFFAEFRDRSPLFRFLHQSLMIYLLNYTPDPHENSPKILYIDTSENLFSFKQFIPLIIPKEYLHEILFTKINQFDLLQSFITDYLSSLIEKTRLGGRGAGIKIVVINSVFKSIEAYSKTKAESQNPKILQSKIGTELIITLRKIARKLGVSIILTSLGTFFNTAEQGISPYLFASVRQAIHYKVLIRQVSSHIKGEKQNYFSIIVQEGPYRTSQRVYYSSETSKENFHLSGFSNLMEGIFF